MIYRFEKQLAQTWFAEIEADSFEEAKELVKSNSNAQWDVDYGGEYELIYSRCLEYANEEAIDEEEYEELEWEPERI